MNETEQPGLPVRASKIPWTSVGLGLAVAGWAMAIWAANGYGDSCGAWGLTCALYYFAWLVPTQVLAIWALWAGVRAKRGETLGWYLASLAVLVVTTILLCALFPIAEVIFQLSFE